MPDFSFTEAAFEGFRFTRERPGAVAAWALATFAFILLSGVLGALVGGDALRAFQALGGHPSVEQVLQAFPPAAAPILVTFLVNFAGAALIYASAMRSFIGIDKRVSFQIGEDERRLFLILVSCFGIYIVLNIVFGVIFGIVESIASLFSQEIPDFLSAIAPYVLVISPIFFIVRLSLCPVIAVDRKRINFKESWVSTKGHFWPLTASLIISLLCFSIVAVVAFMLVVILTELASISTGGFISRPGELLNPEETGKFLTPAMVFAGVIWAVFVGVFLPVILGPQVRAYQAYDAPDPVVGPGQGLTGPLSPF
jgi:hypothetical protein